MEIYEDPKMSQEAFLPIKDHTIFAYREKLVNSFWTASKAINDEAKLKDRADWQKSDDEMRRSIKYLLAFFAIGDGVVVELINSEITRRVKHSDWINFEAMKIANEAIHSETYARLIDIYIDDPQERRVLLEAVQEYAAVRAKTAWVRRWVTKDKPLCYSLFAMIILESVYFSAGFRLIFWFREQGLFPALSLANEYISNDEGVHADCYLYIYTTLKHKLGAEEAHNMMSEAVDQVAAKFVEACIPRGMEKMNAELMMQHVRHIADNNMVKMGYKKIWNVKDPFESSETIALPVQTDFFLKESTNYSLQIAEDDELEDDVFDL